MKPREIREMSDADLGEKLRELHKQLMELEGKRKTGVEKPHLFHDVKKDIARIKTILNERKGASSGQR